MPSISVFKRKGKDGKLARVYSAQIRFGQKQGGASYLRSTGEADRRKAEAAARQLAAEIEAKELPRRGIEILTMETMFSKWIVEHGQSLRSGKDIKWQVEKLLKLIGGAREVRDIGNKDINGFVQDAKAEGAGAVSINRCLETLRSVMNYAADRWEEPVRRISWKTFRQREAKAREVYLSPEEARLLLELLPKHIGLAMIFSIYTGMRLNELQTLIWERIDVERKVAEVETKGGGTRMVWLSDKALRVLSELQGRSPVFDLTNRRKRWERARKAIGREDVHWHDLRAMTASWARQYAKADNTLIAETLGHSDVGVTRRYTRVTRPEVVALLNALPDISAEPTP